LRKLACFISLLLAFSALITAAAPDLVIVDIDFTKQDICQQPYTLANGSLAYGSCSYPVAPENGTTTMQTSGTFFPKPVFKNIGDLQTEGRWVCTTYVDGKWFTTAMIGYFWCGIGSTCPPEMNSINYTYEGGSRLLHLGPGQTLPSAVVGAGGAFTSSNGGHNVTMVISGVTNETNTTNNQFVEFFNSGPEPANNAPNITGVNYVESANETDTLHLSFGAFDYNRDLLRYIILDNGAVRLNTTAQNYYDWHTIDGDNGTHLFAFIVVDPFNASDVEFRNITINNIDFCSEDDHCVDSNDTTWETCEGPQYHGNKTCTKSKTYTLHGQVVESHDASILANKKVSLYNSSIYDPITGAGNYSAIEPKEMPDAVTNKRGFWYANMPDGIYHFLVNGSKEVDFDAYVNSSKGPEKRDSELNENIPTVNFNAEGHIQFSGEYNGANKYICGEKVKFVMFGVNNGGTNETITFSVQDHSVIGGPNAPIVYNGSINYTNESLLVPAGEKLQKTFYWKIPCGLNLGRYDIHVVWNGEVWHKIGNFFLEEDATNPAISATPEHIAVHANQSFTIYYWAGDVPQNGTIYQYKILMLGYNDTAVNVSVDVNNDGSIEQTTYGGDYIPFTGSFNASGERQIKLTATDLSGNNATTFVNATVFITEEEVDAIAVPWYNYFPFNDQGCEDFDLDVDVNLGSSYVSLNADRYAGVDLCEESVGDEYMTPGNGVDDSGEYSDYDKLMEVMYGSFYSSPCMGPEWFQPIRGTTAIGYNYTFLSYFYYLGNVCGIGLKEGPWFNGTGNINFAPQIYDYEPGSDSLIIPYTSSQTFSILARDPNADNFTVKWYVDGNLTKTTQMSGASWPSYNGGTDGYTFIGNSGNIGMHEIRVELADLANSTDLDPYNWQTSRTWHLYVDD